MADPYVRYDWLQSQGELAISLALLDAAASVPFEGVWMPTMFLSGGSIEITGTFSVLSAQLYGTNAVAPLNNQTLTVGGTVGSGHTVSVAVASPALLNTTTVSYTTVGGDTTTTVAAAIAAAINASSALQAIGMQATSSGAVVTVAYASSAPSPASGASSPTSPGVANVVTMSGSSTGAETVTVGNGSNGSVIGSAITAAGLTNAITPLTRWMKMRVTSLTGTSVSAYLHGYN